MTDEVELATEGVRWTRRAGAWLGVGSSPGALLLGAGIAARHGGEAPLPALAVGAAVMAAILFGQGLLGLAPPAGEGTTLNELVPRYLPPASRVGLSVLLAMAMVGWMGFNAGLGGAALSALLNLPPAVGPLLIGLPILVLSWGGMDRWNWVAVVATASALVLTALVTTRLGAPGWPGRPGPGPLGPALADLSGFIGFAAVFALRAPDFSVGLAGRRDLGRCVALFVVPAVVLTLAGVVLHRGTGSDDLVGTLASEGALALGNLLVAASVIAPTFATLYSGTLAVRSITPFGPRPAALAIAVPGLVLAILRFDLLLLPFLSVLAATLPPLVVAMAVEGARRRRGAEPRLIPVWTWAPASALAVGLLSAGQLAAPLAGLALAAAATGLWVVRAGDAKRVR